VVRTYVTRNYPNGHNQVVNNITVNNTFTPINTNSQNPSQNNPAINRKVIGTRVVTYPYNSNENMQNATTKPIRKYYIKDVNGNLV
jgi:hypothetical protein